jgi:hypothetical protein
MGSTINYDKNVRSILKECLNDIKECLNDVEEQHSSTQNYLSTTVDFMFIYEKHKRVITSCEIDESIIDDFLNVFESYSYNKKDDIKIIITDSLTTIYNLKYEDEDEDEYEYDEDIGTCCFCGDECNQMSQSCGSCARGLSGIAIGLPVPEHLIEFLPIR